MDVTDWDSVLQFSSAEDGDVPSFHESDAEFPDKSGSVNQNHMQIPTPPVRYIFFISRNFLLILP